MTITADDLRSRLQLDYRVAHDMFGSVFNGEAYRTASDLEARRNPITSLDQGYLATKYRVDFHVRTLVGPGEFSDVTTVAFDLDQPGYPETEPGTQVLSKQIPYSPHFKLGAPVCLGEIWSKAEGGLLLGQLFVHIAKLLNWDEVGRGSGYVGWNGPAIAYHKRVYGNNALNPDLRYPSVPAYIYGIHESAEQTDLTGMLTPRMQPGIPADYLRPRKEP